MTITMKEMEEERKYPADTFRPSYEKTVLKRNLPLLKAICSHLKIWSREPGMEENV